MAIRLDQKCLTVPLGVFINSLLSNILDSPKSISLMDEISFSFLRRKFSGLISLRFEKFVNKEARRKIVPMTDVILVQVFKSRERLLHGTDCVSLGQLFMFSDVVKQFSSFTKFGY
jgi:hypothetical protein